MMNYLAGVWALVIAVVVMVYGNKAIEWRLLGAAVCVGLAYVNFRFAKIH